MIWLPLIVAERFAESRRRGALEADEFRRDERELLFPAPAPLPGLFVKPPRFWLLEVGFRSRFLGSSQVYPEPSVLVDGLWIRENVWG